MITEKRTIYDTRAMNKNNCPKSYFATKEDLENKTLRSHTPPKEKDKNGHYRSGRILSVRSQ